MRKLFVLAAILFSVTIVGAKELAFNNTNEELTVSTAAIKVPTGNYWNGTNFVKVESNWLRIVINGQMNEYDFNVQMDPRGNYVLTFGRGECITIYSNGRSLYYNGNTYSKR